MTVPEHCGEEKDPGEEVVAPLISGNASIPHQPQEDLDGLPLLMALIDGTYFPIHQCGSTGLGTEFSIDNPAIGGLGCGGDVPGEIITAHACILDCDYHIQDFANASHVIVGEIDGQWNILRVYSSTDVVTGPYSCRCCRLNEVRLEMEITEVIGADCEPVDPEVPLVGMKFLTTRSTGTWVGEFNFLCGGVEKTAAITLLCNSVGEGEEEDIADWSVSTQCGLGDAVAGTVDSLDCHSANSVINGLDSFELFFDTLALAECCGCRFKIRVTLDPTPHACFTEELLDEYVTMEACGLPDLQIGDRVIMAKVPSAEGIEWFLVTACSSWANCDNPCNPPPSPFLCCGQPCNEMPTTLSATIEILDAGDGECACSEGATIPFVSEGCTEDSAWLSEQDTFCVFGLTRLQLDFFRLLCNVSAEECGLTSSDIFTLSYSSPPVSFTLHRATACCDPLFLEFEGTIPACEDEFATLHDVTLRITITE